MTRAEHDAFVDRTLTMCRATGISLSRAYNPGELRDNRGKWTKGNHGKSLPWSQAGDTVTYHGHLGIDRADMPQLSGSIGGRYHPSAEMSPKFIRRLRDKGITVESRRVPASSLKPTQATGDMRAIRGIADSLKSGKMTDTKPIVVSSDGRVLDGHHNWAGRLLADTEGGRPGLEKGMPVIQVGVPMKDLISEARAFARDTGLPSRKTGEAGNPKFKKPPLPKDTLEKYTRPDGTWTPEREKLHRQIIDSILAGHKRQDHPVAMFFGGGPASGKSNLAGPADAAKIDPDEIKAKLPEYSQMLRAGDPQAAAFVHEESSHIAKQATDEAQDGHLHFILDGTGDSSYAKLAGKVNAARRRGYAVHSKYVTVDTNTAVQRARQRAERTGRMVPEPVIREVHASVSRAYEQAVNGGLFDSTELWDTSGDKPRMVIRGAGAQLTVEDPAAWRRFLGKGKEAP